MVGPINAQVTRRRRLDKNIMNEKKAEVKTVR